MNDSSLRVTIIGMAREGMALARFFARRGAKVIISDIKSAAYLTNEIQQLAEWPIQCVLGSHPESILDTDILYVSPGVPRTIPILRQAIQRGVRISSETELLFELCKTSLIGITGSSGKTTTTTLIGKMMELAYPNMTWIGGNIGRPLIEHVDEMESDHKVILELSSFQLEHMKNSPNIALITNLRPNHLDRHPSYEAYKEAKINILNYQSDDDVAVLNWDDPEVRVLADRTKGHIWWFTRRSKLEEKNGTYIDEGWIFLRKDNVSHRIMPVADIKLPGNHNLENVLAAIAVAIAANLDRKSIIQVASNFRGVSHRLETVRIKEDVLWVNDSIATSPDRTVAALRAYPNGTSLILLAGGRDKHLPMEEMAREIIKRVKCVILFGEAGPLIENAIRHALVSNSIESNLTLLACQNLEQAVISANTIAKQGDIILLSPSGTSFDAYPNYEVRGEHFRSLVMQLES